MPPTIDDLLTDAEEQIKASRNVDLWRVSDARVNAEELLSEVLGRPIRSRDLDKTVQPKQQKRFEEFVARRVAGEPIALIVGYTEFMGMKLSVDRDVFLPRNSSELLVAQAVRRARPRKESVVVDVATGTGPIALGIAKKVSGAQVYGVDIWPPSLKVAKRNARALGLNNVRFIESDMLSKLPSKLKGNVDVFTIHPPYVARKQVKTLPKEIKDFEPVVSLTDNSDDGMGLVRRLTQEAPAWLSNNGWVMVEVSPDLSRKVATILRRGGLREVRSVRDSLGATRVVAGKL